MSSPTRAVIAEIIKHDVIRLLLQQIRQSQHLCVIRNCLYSLSNMCHFDAIKSVMNESSCRSKQILNGCLEAHGHKDPLIKKWALKILRKIQSVPSISSRTPSISARTTSMSSRTSSRTPSVASAPHYRARSLKRPVARTANRSDFVY